MILSDTFYDNRISEIRLQTETGGLTVDYSPINPYYQGICTLTFNGMNVVEKSHNLKGILGDSTGRFRHSQVRTLESIGINMAVCIVVFFLTKGPDTPTKITEARMYFVKVSLTYQVVATPTHTGKLSLLQGDISIVPTSLPVVVGQTLTGQNISVYGNGFTSTIFLF